MVRGESADDPARGLPHHHGDFQETLAQGVHRGLRQFAVVDVLLKGLHQGIDGQRPDQAKLIGRERTAARPVQGKIIFEILDRVLHDAVPIVEREDP